MKKLSILLFALGLVFNNVLAQSFDKVPESVSKRNSFKRYEWMHKQRSFPNDTIPYSYFVNQKKYEQNKYKNLANKAGDLICESFGPAGLEMKSHPHWGFVSGRVRALAVHPTDPNTVYIGAASGGLWKTTDGGASWMDIGKELASLTFGAIAIDPKNPLNVYAGGGEWMRYFNSTTYDGRGLYRSTDGGISWTLINDEFGSQTHFSSIEVDPFNSNIVFATLASGYSFIQSPGNEGIWKSTDAGLTWRRVLANDDSFDILPDPAIQNRIYATGNGGFYISTDNGETWRITSASISTVSKERIQIAIPNVSPNIIYILIFGGNKMQMYKSADSGETWSSASPIYDSGQGWYDLLLAVNPENADEVYLGDAELRRTTNGGGTINYVGGPYNNQLMHVDFHCMAFAPSNPAIRYIGCDGGVYKSTNSGSSWFNINMGLSTIQFYRIAAHPTNPLIVFGGAQDNSNYRTTDGGVTWGTVTFADGMECFVDYAEPNNVYMSTQYGSLYRSSTGGAYNSFVNITPDKGNQPAAWVVPYFIHPLDNQVIFTATDRPWVSTNRGTDWLPMTPSALTTGSIETMNISPLNPDIMLLSGDNTKVFLSTNAGNSWANISSNVPGPARYISRVVCDPYDEKTIYLVRSGFGSGKIYKSEDLGVTWTNISGDLPDIPHNDLFIDPRIPGHLYTANDFGVYRTVNGGSEWTRASFEIPLVPVQDFDYVDYGDDRILYVGTHGRSAFRIYLVQPTGKFIDLARPVGSENWIVGTEQRIVWWSNDIQSIDIKYSDDNGINWNTIAENVEAALREYNWVIPQINSNECFVRLVDSDDASNFDESNRAFSILPLAVPAAGSPVDNEGGIPLDINLTWSIVQGASYYHLMVSETPEFLTPIVDESELTDAEFMLENLEFNKTYFWKLRALNSGYETEFSEIYSFTTQLEKPELSQPENNSKDIPVNPLLSWTPVSGASNYTVQLSKSILFSTVDLEYGGILSNQFTVENLENNKKYFWRVKASNELTFSDYSDRWVFQTVNITSVENNTDIPNDFILYPNYPNPFNPETNIKFGMPESGYVKLTIYNSLGQLIERILDDMTGAGYYNVKWNASKYPSGVYFAKLEIVSDNSGRQFSQNIKLLFLK